MVNRGLSNGKVDWRMGTHLKTRDADCLTPAGRGLFLHDARNLVQMAAGCYARY